MNVDDLDDAGQSDLSIPASYFEECLRSDPPGGPPRPRGVTRELGEYVRFLGEEVDASGLDHDVADWQGEYDGVAGAMLSVVNSAGEVVGTAGGLGGRVLRLDSERRLEAAIRLYRTYGFKDSPDYNRNPRAAIWMELRLAPGRS